MPALHGGWERTTKNLASIVGTQATARPTLGQLRVRIGGMADAPMQLEAYLSVSLSLEEDQAAPIAAVRSLPLPHEESALLLHSRWQEFGFRITHDVLSRGAFVIETIAWSPGRGEHSLGRLLMPVRDVARRSDGRIELSVSPTGVLVEMQWMAWSRPTSSAIVGCVPGGVDPRSSLLDWNWTANPRSALLKASGHTNQTSLVLPADLERVTRVGSVCGLPPQGYVFGHSGWHQDSERHLYDICKQLHDDTGLYGDDGSFNDSAARMLSSPQSRLQSPGAEPGGWRRGPSQY